MAKMEEVLKFLLHQLKDQFLVLLALAILAYVVDRRADRRARHLDEGVRTVGGSVQSLFAAFELIGGVLARQGQLSAEDMGRFFKIFSEDHRKDIASALAAGKGNPLALDEYQRLENYTQMMSAGMPFTLDQARDFHALTQKLREDKPEVPGAWILAMLAAFLVGVYIGKQDR